MKIYSWNVNGIRAVINKGAFADFIKSENPDVICLQEIKAKENQIELDLGDYTPYWYPAEKAGYSGTAILTKIKPIKVTNGFPKDIIDKYKVSGDTYGDPNLEGRVIVAEFKDFYLATVYTPNAKNDLSRVDLRHKHWDPAFLGYMKSLEKTKPVIFCGDLNVAYTEEDLANPKSNVGKKGFTNEEREGFQSFIDAGFIDSLRVYKKGKGHYTWWSHFANARTRNVGWRIDYFLISKSLKSKLLSADIIAGQMGSDHCPVSIEIQA